MSNKFHLNPATGSVSRCSAKTKCPFGGKTGAENHFDSIAEARADFENKMKNQTVPEATKEKPSRARKTLVQKELESLSAPQIESLVKTASAEHGENLRRHLRLLTHPDLEVARAARKHFAGYGHVEAAMRVAAVQADLEENDDLLTSIRERIESAPTEKAQIKYKLQLEKELENNRNLRSRLLEVKAEAAGYEDQMAAQLYRHENAVKKLKEFQNASENSGVKTAAPLALALDTLPQNYKDISEGKAVREARSIFVMAQDGKPERVLEAAVKHGDPYHVENAKGLIRHTNKVAQLEADVAHLKREENEASFLPASEETMEAVGHEIKKLESSLAKENKLKRKYETRIARFNAEAKDVLAYRIRQQEELLERVNYGDAVSNNQVA